MPKELTHQSLCRIDEDNDALEALRALQYDGTPAENAQSFKEQGNELVQVKKWNDAKEFYSKGIAVLSKRIGEKRESDGDGIASEEREKELKLEETCYVNRALCNLELRNYRSTTLDCRNALRLNAKNIKAFYRSAQALFALDKLSEASDACTRGLAIDAGNTALKDINMKIVARAAEVKVEDDRKQKQAVMFQRQRFTLATALKARKIKTRKTAQPPEMEDATIHLAPDPLSPESTLQFPVILLYPMHAQSDFIKSFAETDTVSMHLDYIFPLPWDEKFEYLANQVELYMETASGGLVKVGKNVSLLKTLSSDVEIVDELVRINVVPKGLSRRWVDEMRQRLKK